jgi:hypothetical protein
MNPPTGSYMTIDEELPQMVSQKIRVIELMRIILFDPMELVIVNLVP